MGEYGKNFTFVTSLNRIIKMQNNWLSEVELACKQAFAGHHIPSHDFGHHQRVWKYANEIAQYLKSNSSNPEPSDLGLMVACYFHDTGLTINPNEDHGLASLQILNSWVEANPTIMPLIDQSVYAAVLHHDDKSYKKQGLTKEPLSLDNTLAILCIADDMDAFSYLGILRYTEIYLMRKIEPETIPSMVSTNLESRFRFMEESIESIPEQYNHQRQRYAITAQFFKDLTLQEKIRAEYATFAALIQSVVVEQKQGWKTLAEELKHQSWSSLKPVINGIVEEMGF